MHVVYVTYPAYLDFSIEYINQLKHLVDIDVYVVIYAHSVKSTILQLDNFTYKPGTIVSHTDLKDNIKNYDLLNTYIDGCKSFNFVLLPEKSISMGALATTRNFCKLINKSKPDVVHFDDIILNIIGIRIFLKSENILLNVHDPISHSGENNWRRKIIRKVIYPITKRFILFSEFSTNQFIDHYNPIKKVDTLSLTPYYFYSKIQPEKINIGLQRQDKVILFFGRLSQYKGIDELLGAFANLFTSYTNAKLIIAGRGNYDYVIPAVLKLEVGRKLIIIERFISNAELSFLMKNATIVVCPYRDATQSGVVMTALAFKKYIIVSNVGGLHEPINSGNGFVYPLEEPEGLESILKQVLINGVNPSNFVQNPTSEVAYNANKLVEIYKQL